MQDEPMLNPPSFNSSASPDAPGSRPTSPEAASAVIFEHDAFAIGPGTSSDFLYEQYSWGLQKLPRLFNKALTEGAFAHHVAGTERPVYPAGHAGAGDRMVTQQLSFKFRSEGVFTNTGAHVAIILRSQSTAQWNRGRGFIFGHQVLLPSDPNACPAGGPGTAHAQPETWWTVTSEATQTQRRFVWGQPHCSTPTLRDRRDYGVTVQVTDGGLIEYSITDLESGERITESLQDTINEESALIDEFTGYTLALVFASSQDISWRIRFYEIGSSWS